MTLDFPRKNSYNTEDIFIAFLPFIAPESSLFTEEPEETGQRRKIMILNGGCKICRTQGGTGGVRVDYFYKEG